MSKLPKVKSSRSRSPSPDRSGKAVGKGKDSTVGFSDKDKGGQTRSFSKEMKQSCWEMAETVPGRDPDRWRRDAVRNIIFKGFTKCQGPLCYEFDHVKPYVKVYGDFDDGGGYEMVKKSQQKMEADQDYDQDDGANNAYGLRENPKRSWRVSSLNSVEDFDVILLKAFDAYDEHDGNVDADGGVANPIRKKRSYTRYTSPKHDNVGTSLSFSSCSDDYEVAAICLIMISRGVRSLDELKLVFSRQPDFVFSDCEYSGTSENNVEFEVSVDESMGYGSFVNESELGLKKDLNVGYGSGQLEMNLVGPAMVNCKSSKIPRSCDQDFGDRDGTGILLEPKRRYKDQVRAICYKKFRSAQALGSHKRVHNKDENKSSRVNSNDVEFKLTWVHSEIEWDPFAMAGEQQLDGIEIGYYGNVKRDKFTSALPGDPFA
ncbi:hypothetical protein Tco_1176456 [Tanacetum coccineum]